MKVNRRLLVRWIITILILAGGVVLCFFRWNAWFGNPEEPHYTGTPIDYQFSCFGDESVAGFRLSDDGWHDRTDTAVLRIALFGDVHNMIDSVQWATIHRRHPHIDCYAQLGDFVERGYFYYFQQLYRQLSETGFEHLPIINCPGNHEYRKGLIRRLPVEWRQIFRHPQNGPNRFKGLTYYVDFPHLRFIVIDTNGLQRLSDFTIVATWAGRALRQSEGRYTVVMMHHPVHSCGAGRQNILMRVFFGPVLRQADIVFAGHDHNYARRLPFIDTNSAKKFYLNKVNAKDDRIGSGRQMYEMIEVKSNTLTVTTYLMDSGDKYDSVKIVKDGNQRRTTVQSFGQEIIDIPDKYAQRNDLKVRRFRNRRYHRLQSQDGQ